MAAHPGMDFAPGISQRRSAFCTTTVVCSANGAVRHIASWCVNSGRSMTASRWPRETIAVFEPRAGEVFGMCRVIRDHRDKSRVCDMVNVVGSSRRSRLFTGMKLRWTVLPSTTARTPTHASAHSIKLAWETYRIITHQHAHAAAARSLPWLTN